MQLTSVRNCSIIATLTFLFLVFFWKFLGTIGSQVSENYHLHNMCSFVTPVAQVIFVPVILINRFFIKLSMPLAFLVSSPIVETLAIQGLQKLAMKYTSGQGEAWKKWGLIILRVSVAGLLFALGHKIPEYLHPTDYSRQLLHAGLFSHLLGGLVFAGFYEYSKSLIAVSLLHSALNLATYLGFSTWMFSSVMSLFS